MREIRSQAAEIFEELKNTPHDARAEAEARERLKSLQAGGQELSRNFAKQNNSAPRTQEISLTPGMAVKVEGYPQAGTVMSEPKKGQVIVQIGPVKLTTNVSKVSAAKQPSTSLPKPRANIGFSLAQNASTEIHLRAMRAEDALHELEKFVDDAVLAGLPHIRIVHGKGTGVLRQVAQEFLRKNPNIERFRDGDSTEGGQGVTIAYIK